MANPTSEQSLTHMRRELHRAAEASGAEARTARIVHRHLQAIGVENVVTELGGHGIAALFDSGKSGPTVLLRSDMDALPIPESIDVPHASRNQGFSHKCGHDGHMTMLLGAAHRIAEQRPERGRVVLLFQPAEETGQGAAAVIADPRFADLRPDRVLALHNLPGHALHEVVVREGAFASASRGMIIELEGISSHAAEPEAGRSPVTAAMAITQALLAAPSFSSQLHEVALLTIVGIEVGGPAFGTSPGHGRVMATLRTYDDDVMQRLASHCRDTAQGIAQAHGMRRCEVQWVEEFPATHNDARVVAVLERCAREQGLEVTHRERPFAWSEDFGHFTAMAPGALFGLGSGTEQPALHHPDYDFPDALAPTGAELFARCVQALLLDELPKATR